MLEQAEYLRLSQPSDTTNRVSYRLANLQMLPFPNEFFDVVTCRLVLNHFHSPQRIVEEFVRVLRPGGIFLMAELLSVADPVKRATQNAIEERRNPAHVAARSAEQYDKMITDAGLEIEKTESIDIPRNLREWLNAYHTPDAVAATVIEMVEAGLETDAAGIGARRRGASIEFVQRMYYLKATKPQE
jgi:SAM-dependent methyltransferase